MSPLIANLESSSFTFMTYEAYAGPQGENSQAQGETPEEVTLNPYF